MYHTCVGFVSLVFFSSLYALELQKIIIKADRRQINFELKALIAVVIVAIAVAVVTIVSLTLNSELLKLFRG